MKNTLLLIFFIAITAECTGKNTPRDTTTQFPKQYWSSGLNAGIISTALIWKSYNFPSGTIKQSNLGAIRFSAIFHIGALYHYNFNRYFGFYTGADVKNIGYTESVSKGDRTLRVYTIGMPVAVKIGDMRRTKPYGFAGCGLDIALNLKEKYISDDKKKTKTNEWFSNRGKLLLPYIFAGLNFRGVSLKAQYYPGNFVNPNYSTRSGSATVKPYEGTSVHLFLLTVGFPNLLQDIRDFKNASLS